MEALKIASRVPAVNSVPDPRAGVPPYAQSCARPDSLSVRPKPYETISETELGRQIEGKYDRQRFGNMTGWVDMTLQAREKNRCRQGLPPGPRQYGIAPRPSEWLAEQKAKGCQQENTQQLQQQQDLNTSRSASMPPSARPPESTRQIMSTSSTAFRRDPRVPEIAGLRRAVDSSKSFPSQGQYSAASGVHSASSMASSMARGVSADPIKKDPQNAAWIMRAQQALKMNQSASAGNLRATGGVQARAGFAGSWSGWQGGGPGIMEWGAGVAGPGKSFWEP